MGEVRDVDLFIVFFFFQAEDGIRDPDVTGVQTCALPIYTPAQVRRHLKSDQTAPAPDDASFERDDSVVLARACDALTAAQQAAEAAGVRSEERRVGKECRSRWWR